MEEKLVQSSSKIARTGRVQNWKDDPEGRLPVSCTVFVVEDSMEGENGIEASWRFVSHGLRNGAGVAVHLSNLRAKGDENGKGLVASGPVSFGKIYSTLNEILRRGGKYKNGAVVLHLDYDHPDAIAFINASRTELPWVKRCINVDQNFLEKASPELIQALLSGIAKGDIWLNKMRTDEKGVRIYANVCVAGDTLVQTTEGPKAIASLVNKPFVAIVDGKEHPSSERGAWSNGFQQTYEMHTKEGFSLRATGDHRIMTPHGWKNLSSLTVGEKITLQHHDDEDVYCWEGKGTHDEGWLIGWLLGDGTYQNDQTAKLDFYGSKKSLLDGALKKLSTLDNHLQGDHYSDLRTGTLVEKSDRTSVSTVGLARMAVEYGVSRQNKTATALLEDTSADFQRGFLEAYFSADGTVNLGSAGGNGKCVFVTSVNLRNLQTIQRMLLRFGIRSRIWKERYNGGETLLPDGKGGRKLYQTQKASRLDISGQADLRKFAALVGFTLPEKAEKLEKLLSSYRVNPRKQRYEATVESVTPYDVEEVFDCSIPTAGAFDANGIYVSNCLEVYLPHRGTCLLEHVNLGMCSIENLQSVFVDGMEELCALHARTGVGDTGEYLPSDIDKQVGLGMLGLANFLAIHDVSYKEFGKAIEAFFDKPSEWASIEDTDIGRIVQNMHDGIHRAAHVAREHGMVRAFAIAPTASCSYRHQDIRGYTTTPEIAPPIGRYVDRDSGTFGVESFDYGPVETAEEVGWDNYMKVANGIVRLYQSTHLFHGYSFNSWSDVVVYDEKFLRDWLESRQTSLYYSLQILPDTQRKDDAYAALDDDFKSMFGLNDETEQDSASCDFEAGFCSSCAE